MSVLPSASVDACPLCGATPLPVSLEGCDPRFPRPERFRVAWCARCGIASTHPRPTDLRASYPDAYDPYQPDAGTQAQSRVRRTLIEAERRLSPSLSLSGRPGRILDVGCGNGAYLASLATCGFDVLGVEISPRAAGLVRGRGLPVLVGDFLEVPLPAGAFDVVAMNHYLEHSPDPRASLRRARAVLREGGRLVVGVPNFASWARRAFGEDWSDLELPRHLFHFTPKGLGRLVQECGFAVEAILPDPTADANSILTSLQGRMGRRDDPILRRAYPVLHALLYPVALPLAVARRSAWITAFARKLPEARA